MASKSLKVNYHGKGPEDVDLYTDLAGNSTAAINTYSLLVLCFVVGAGFLGHVFSLWHPAPGRPKGWVIGLLVGSYMLLVPGLAATLFSFDVIVSAMGHRVAVRPRDTEGPCTESMTTIVHLLIETGSSMGAALVVLYALVIPGAKLAALLLAERWRHSEDPGLVVRARKCVHLVQLVSKWASPDMFAYVLLQHLIRGLYHPPLVEAGARLDVGFACFSVFCVCSTISALGVHAPPDIIKADEHAYNAQVVRKAAPAWLVKCAVVSLSVAFVAFFSVGLRLPCMALEVKTVFLYQPFGPIKVTMKPLVDKMVAALLDADVSVLGCMRSLLRWVGEGEAISAFAFVLYAVFVIALTVLDMVALIAATFGICRGPALKAAALLKKLSMLDVSCMGVIVVTFCGSIYKAQGIIVTTQRGLGFLLAAEACHYATYYLVMAAVGSFAPNPEVDSDLDALSGREDAATALTC